MPEIDFNNYIIGVPSRPNQLIDNIYQILDNFSRVIGTHTVKVGGQYHFNQLEENLSNVANGNFFFGTAFNGGNSETGSDFVDFLLGAIWGADSLAASGTTAFFPAPLSAAFVSLAEPPSIVPFFLSAIPSSGPAESPEIRI